MQFPFLIPFLQEFLKRTNSQKFLLNQFSIAGFQFYDGESIIDKLKKGDLLKLIAEPKNPFDEYAVMVKYQDKQIGYIPRSDNRHISRMLVQGIQLDCKIVSIQPEEDPWQKIQVAVYLIKIPIQVGSA